MGGVLVISGGSRGIGAATARLAANAGYAVAINYVANAGAANSLAEEIRGDGGKAVAIQADVSTDEGAIKLFNETDAQLGTVSALFNNAGIFHRNSTILDVTEDLVNEQWRVNITSQFLCAREAVKRMSTKLGGHGGVIVNMSSAAARIGGGGSSTPYAASKGAIDTFTHGLAQEVAGQGIRVNGVRPGLIETDIHATSGDPNRIQNLVHMVPMGRAGTAREVGEVVVWLMSDKASYVTDTLVDIGGGR